MPLHIYSGPSVATCLTIPDFFLPSMLNQGYFALHVYDFLKKVHIYISIQDYMAKRDLRVHTLGVVHKLREQDFRGLLHPPPPL